ncbi:MAG: hypothetical protein CBB89_05955 [Rhizobiales bacterium TMED29]|nr:MAG: hypothetical protein CBB89_05955 [Rhizobiales bacterium TMED29]
MSNSNKRSLPSKKRIYNYWITNEYLNKELGMELGDWRDCFACGFPFTQRCHIVSFCEGGSNNEDNLHLLCPNCHLMSEDLSVSAYWKWIKNMNLYFWKSDWFEDRFKLIGFDKSKYYKLLFAQKFEQAASEINQHFTYGLISEEQIRKNWERHKSQ